MENPELKILSLRGLGLAVWEWPGIEPAMIFAHATGFHGRCWDQIARQFPEHRKIAVDFRGHGRSAKPEPPYQWREFGRDLAAVAEHLKLHDAVGIGHSMGGHAVVSSVALRPETFAALLLIDPTIFPPEYYGHSLMDTSFVLRRRNVWSSADEMFERFRNRPPFASWQPEILRDYCDYGVLPDGNGFVLACPPSVEASIYNHSTRPDANLYGEIPLVRQPVVVLRAGTLGTLDAFELSSSPTPGDLASKFPHGRDIHRQELGHFVPMEWPSGVVAQIRDMVSLLK